MTFRATLAALLFVGIAAPASASPQSEALLRDFVAWVDSSPDWVATVGTVRSDGADTIAEGISFTRKAPDVTIRFGTLTLSNLAARPDGGFTATAIALADATADSGFSTTTIPAASARDVSMPSFAGVTYDPKHLMTSVARFYSLAAAGKVAESLIPELTIRQRPLDPAGAEMLITYRNLSATGLADGILASQQVGPISMGTTGPGGEAVGVDIGRLYAERLDLAAIAHILDPAAYRDGRGDQVWRPVLARTGYETLRIAGDDGTVATIDEVAMEGLDGRQAEEPFTGPLDELLDPDTPQDARDDVALEVLTSLTRAWRVGNARMTGLKINSPEAAGTTASLASLTLTGASSDGFDSLILKTLAGSSPQGALSLDALEVAGFVAPDVRALVQFAAIEKNADAAEHEQAVARSFAALPRVAHVALAGLSAGPAGKAPATLDSFTLDFADWNEIFAGSTKMALTRLDIPRALLELDPETTQIFDTLGYDNLVYGLTLDDTWDIEAGTDKATWGLSFENAADLTLTYELGGLTRDWLMKATADAARKGGSDAAAMAMLEGLTVGNATVTITDRSLLDRGFAVAAAKQNLNVDGPAYRQQMRAALPFLISAVAPPEIASLVVKPVQAFLAGGQTLVASAAPSSPLTVTDIITAAQDPLALPKLLNLTLESKAAE